MFYKPYIPDYGTKFQNSILLMGIEIGYSNNKNLGTDNHPLIFKFAFDRFRHTQA